MPGLLWNETGTLAGTLHRRWHEGRPYWAVPVVMAVPGVLSGSEGPLHYAAEEWGRSAGQWDGVPVTIDHPREGGVPISARSPIILARWGVGFLREPLFDGKLRAVAWLDEERLRWADSLLLENERMIPRLERGEPIEVSTGLLADQEAAPSGSVYEGSPYSHVAKNILPDHLALLPAGKGACNIQRGCGLLANTLAVITNTHPGEPLMPLTPEQRTAHVQYLVTNCACWKKPGDDRILNSLPDDKLDELRKAAEEAAKPTPAPAPPSDAAPPLSFTPQQIDTLVEALREKLSLPKPAPAPPTPAVTPAPVPTLPALPVAPALTANDWLKHAPPDIRAGWEASMALVQNQKLAIVNRLTAHIQEPLAKQQMHTDLMARSIGDLNTMLALVPAGSAGAGPAPLFEGAAGGPSTFALNAEEQADVLDLETEREKFMKKTG